MHKIIAQKVLFPSIISLPLRAALCDQGGLTRQEVSLVSEVVSLARLEVEQREKNMLNHLDEYRELTQALDKAKLGKK